MATRAPSTTSGTVRAEILRKLQETPLDRALESKAFRELLEQDAKGDKPLFTAESIRGLDEARAVRHAKAAAPPTGLFFSNKSVLLVPGFMGSQLRDDGPTRNGLIWIDPTLYFTSSKEKSEISALKLAKREPDKPDSDAADRVSIREDGAVPIIYAGLKYYLETGRCEVRTAAFDWRKDIDESAALVRQRIESYAAEFPNRPLFLIAHSQGSLVARRALQMMGKDSARRLVNRLILLGPASFGTFSAAFAIGGNHESIAALADYGLEWPDDLGEVLQSMSGLYQMVPWKEGTVDMSKDAIDAMGQRGTWAGRCDTTRLAKFFAWGKSLDTEFFNDRTSIILGDDPKTPSAVTFIDGVPTPSRTAQGDGTVPDGCALLPGVTDVARAAGASHMTLPLNRRVMQSVWRMIQANLTVQAMRPSGRAGAEPAVAKGDTAKGVSPRPEIAALPDPVDLMQLAGMKPHQRVGPKAASASAKDESAPPVPFVFEPPPPPATRRLRVFSFDPLLATDPDAMGTETIVLKLDWDDASADGAKLQPGPVGEYLEVVDYDPASRRFYPPVDLNHPNLLAQDGMPVSETEPRFHQQMVYAVAMSIIAVFERALGRSIQWSPDLRRDANGKVIPNPNGEFVRRLRIYPHAMREANAYYDPRRKALLFGYFPAQSKPGGKVLPNGTVFTCLSFDVIAHEMTHAVLDGMHRYFLIATNPDVLAFHEAFADIVALFQHFSHPDVLRTQVAKVAGRLENEGMLGQLAQQFGEAIGMHGSLRSYLGSMKNGVWEPTKPDPSLLARTTEVHDRGAILVAAMFTAFQTIYRKRTRDLMRIATHGSGLQPPGDLHPDLVGRLADEAAKTARHLLTMAIRALDYLPPVDVTFGEYLRALVTADYDIVPADGHLYRVSLVDAFRQWGIYPQHVSNLSVDSLLWGPPKASTTKLDMDLFREILAIGNGNLRIDRGDMYQRQREMQVRVHDWLRECFGKDPKLAQEWGLDVSPTAPHSIDRDGKPDPLPMFEIHSLRRCRRVGPDQQERIDLLIEVVQKRRGYLNPDDQEAADAGTLDTATVAADFAFLGGVTLVVDPRAGRIRYAIYKSIRNDPDTRLTQVRQFLAGGGRALGLRDNYFRADGNPFPYLHATEG